MCQFCGFWHFLGCFTSFASMRKHVITHGGGMCILFEICEKRPFQKCMVWGGGQVGPDSAWRNRAPGPHRNTARQAMDGLWTEVCGQQKQSNDPGNNQHILNTPIIGRR